MKRLFLIFVLSLPLLACETNEREFKFFESDLLGISFEYPSVTEDGHSINTFVSGDEVELWVEGEIEVPRVRIRVENIPELVDSESFDMQLWSHFLNNSETCSIYKSEEREDGSTFIFRTEVDPFLDVNFDSNCALTSKILQFNNVSTSVLVYSSDYTSPFSPYSDFQHFYDSIRLQHEDVLE